MTDEPTNNSTITEPTTTVTSSEGSNTINTVTGQTDTDSSIAPTEQSWLSSLPEDLREDPSLKDYKDVVGLAKSHISLNRMLGSSIRIPSEDASPEARKEFLDKVSNVDGVIKLPDPNNQEEVNKFYTKLGRPEKPENYDIKIPSDVPEEMVDSNTLNDARNMFFKLGLTSGQANALVQYELNKQAQEMDRLAAEKDQGQQQLKQIWGADFEARKNAAKNYFNLLGEKYPDVMQSLLRTHANNPAIYVMAAELGQTYQERGHIKGQGIQQFGLTPEEARAKIKEIRSNPNDPVNIAGHKDHEARLEYMSKLYDLANPKEGSSI